MNKVECLRCGYNEFPSSLHKHHIDLNHNNNNPQNIIILCSNCHFGIHHNKWSIKELGYPIIKEIKTVKKRKPSLKIVNMKLRDEIKDLNNEIIELNNEIAILISLIKDIKRSTHHNLELHSIEKKVLFDYIRLNSLTLYEDMMLIEGVINSIRCRHIPNQRLKHIISQKIWLGYLKNIIQK